MFYDCFSSISHEFKVYVQVISSDSYFLDCIKSTHAKNLKIIFYITLTSFRLFTQNSHKITFYTLRYFWSIGEREESKLNQIMFCFFSCFHLKILAPKSFYMQVQSVLIHNFFQEYLWSKLGRRHSFICIRYTLINGIYNN